MKHALTEKPAKPIKAKPIRTTTDSGIWLSYDYPDGQKYREFRSHAEWMDRPFISFTSGKDPETNQMAHAYGFIAIGQRASGIIAIGQFVNGVISVGQFATGRVAAIGQFVVAPISIGQFSIGILAVGQIGVAGWGIYQIGAVALGGVGQLLFNFSTL